MIIRYFFPLTVNNTARNIVRCLAKDDINGALVECRTAVTGTDDDGLTGMVAQVLENVLAQCLEVPYYDLVCFHRGVETVVDAVGSQRERRNGVATKTQGSCPVLFYVAHSVANSNRSNRSNPNSKQI